MKNILLGIITCMVLAAASYGVYSFFFVKSIDNGSNKTVQQAAPIQPVQPIKPIDPVR